MRGGSPGVGRTLRTGEHEQSAALLAPPLLPDERIIERASVPADGVGAPHPELRHGPSLTTSSGKTISGPGNEHFAGSERPHSPGPLYYASVLVASMHRPESGSESLVNRARPG